MCDTAASAPVAAGCFERAFPVFRFARRSADASSGASHGGRGQLREEDDEEHHDDRDGDERTHAHRTRT